MKKLFEYFTTYNGWNVFILFFCFLLPISFLKAYEYGTDRGYPNSELYYHIFCVIFWSSGLICLFGSMFSMTKFGPKALIAPALFVVGLIIYFLLFLLSHSGEGKGDSCPEWIYYLALIIIPLVAFAIASTFNNKETILFDKKK